MKKHRLIPYSLFILFITACSTSDENNNQNTDIVKSLDKGLEQNACDATLQIQQPTSIFVSPERLQHNSLLFPSKTMISTLDSDEIAINDSLLSVLDEGGEGELKLISLGSFTQIGNLVKPGFTATGMSFDKEGFLVINDGSLGIVQINVTDPGMPEKISQILTERGSIDSIIRGNIIYQASYSEGLISSDLLFSRELPDRVGSATLSTLNLCNYQARALAKLGDYLLVAARQGGLYVVDVSAGDGSLNLVKHYQPEQRDFIDVATDGHIVYIASHKHIEVFDFTNPAEPQAIAVIVIETPDEPLAGEDPVRDLGYVESISVNDGYATISLSGNAILLHKTSDPVDEDNLILLQLDQTPKNAIYQDKAVYITTGEKIIKLSE